MVRSDAVHAGYTDSYNSTPSSTCWLNVQTRTLLLENSCDNQGDIVSFNTFGVGVVKSCGISLRPTSSAHNAHAKEYWEDGNCRSLSDGGL